MRTDSTPPDPLSIRTYLEDGAWIAGIVLIWTVFAVVAAQGIGNLGPYGSIFNTLGTWLAFVFVVAGVLNAVVYVLYRAIDYWQS